MWRQNENLPWNEISWLNHCHVIDTVETLYSTIYYSKYFIELNFDKSTQYVALWTRASYGVSFMSISTEIDRVIKGFYCIDTNQSLAVVDLSEI